MSTRPTSAPLNAPGFNPRSRLHKVLSVGLAHARQLVSEQLDIAGHALALLLHRSEAGVELCHLCHLCTARSFKRFVSGIEATEERLELGNSTGKVLVFFGIGHGDDCADGHGCVVKDDRWHDLRG